MHEVEASAGAVSEDTGRDARVLPFVLRTMALLVGAVAFAAVPQVGVVAVFFGALLQIPYVVPNLDVFWTPVVGGLLAAGLAGAIVSAGEPIRRSSRSCQVRAVRACVAAGAGLGLALYVGLGWAMPLALRAPVFPSGVSLPATLEVHPFLLTTPELFEVQRVFRGAGGFSSRVALTLELRLWLAFSLPVAAMFGTVAMLMDRPRAHLVRLLLVAATALGFFQLAVGLTVGPGYFLRPTQLPMYAAWILLGGIGGGSAWWLRRRYRERGVVGLGDFRVNGGSTSPS